MKGIGIITGVRCRRCGKECIHTDVGPNLCGCDDDYDEYLRVKVTKGDTGIPIKDIVWDAKDMRLKVVLEDFNV